MSSINHASTSPKRLSSSTGFADPDEAEAISLLKAGEIAGLEFLVRRHQSQAVHTALLIVRDRKSAEDIVQDAFLKSYRKIANFDQSRLFKPWFLRIVINDSLKWIKRNASAQSLDVLEDEGQRLVAGTWLSDAPMLPEAALDLTELQQHVWQAMAQLTPEQRAVIVLRYFLDASEREMIEELDKPLSTVKWWLFTARRELRTLLQSARAGIMSSGDHS